MPLYLFLVKDGKYNGESEVVATWMVVTEDAISIRQMANIFKSTTRGGLIQLRSRLTKISLKEIPSRRSFLMPRSWYVCFMCWGHFEEKLPAINSVLHPQREVWCLNSFKKWHLQKWQLIWWAVPGAKLKSVTTLILTGVQSGSSG